MNQILIPVSPGELLDKITILEIKSERIESVEKRSNVSKELGMLNKVWATMIPDDADITAMRVELKSINETCLLYTSPSPRDRQKSRMPSSA